MEFGGLWLQTFVLSEHCISALSRYFTFVAQAFKSASHLGFSRPNFKRLDQEP